MIDYGVLKGKIVETRRNEDTPGSTNHFHIIVEAKNELWRCPVNIQSADKSEVWFKVEQPLGGAPLLTRLAALEEGLTKLTQRTTGLTLDYVREPMFDRGRMIHLPFKANGPQDDIQDFLASFTDRAQSEAGSQIYVFGSWWRDKAFPVDAAFGTNRGVHDVHMNQGNDAGHKSDDGVFQDGGLLLCFPSTGWAGFFCAFDSQVWFTDDQQGHRLPGFEEGPLVGLDTHPNPSPPETPTQPESLAALAIVAALVNPAGPDEGKETVTLFNASTGGVDLAGWQIVDKNGKRDVLQSRQLPSNQSVTIPLTGAGAQLGNKGGTIRLLAPDGAQAEVVTYSARQAEQGRIIRF
jgi:uncharacterized protein YukJ